MLLQPAMVYLVCSINGLSQLSYVGQNLSQSEMFTVKQ